MLYSRPDQYLIDPADVQSLSDFQRQAKDSLKRLKARRRPTLLTVNGRSAAVLLDPESYRKLVNKLLEMEEVEAVRDSIDDARQGRSRPFSEFVEEFRAKHKVPRRTRRSA
jgi:prevent-host-death family protein